MIAIRRLTLLRAVLSMTCAVACGATARAQTSPPAAPVSPASPTTVAPAGDFRTFHITPTKVPNPILKYQFTMPHAERIEGNAATAYLQSHMWIPEDEKLGTVTDLYLETDSDEAYARAIAARAPWLNTEIPAMIATATQLDRCDWGFPLRGQHVNTLLPHLNQSREMANLLMARARLAHARGEIDRALELIRHTSVMADRLDDGTAVMVNALVAIGIQHQCMDRVAALMDDRRTPNLYWALRGIGMPFVDLRAATEVEDAMLVYAVPDLRHADAGQLTGAQWRESLQTARNVYGNVSRQLNRPAQPSSTTDAAAPAHHDDKLLEAARAHAAGTRGLGANEARRADPDQLVGEYYYASYRAIAQQTSGAMTLPYPQMLPMLERTSKDLARLADEQPSNPFAVIPPSTARFAVTSGRLDRRLAAMVVVEALKAYAASHEGKLPPTLAAIEGTPAPENPITGEPFEYEVQGDVAILSDDGTLLRDWPLRYEVRIRP